MGTKGMLGAWDYAIIAFTMMISVAIGIYFRFTGSRQKTANEFLMAGRSMGRFPAVFSLVVTKLSAIAIIGEPSDIYMYGTQRCTAFVFIFIGSFVTAYLYLPVYFAVGASTIYEFLERRFGLKTRKMVSVFCYIQTLLNMSVVIYTPAIAMSAVTNFSTETSIFLVGGVCIIFSAAGGLKAVMWADVFQAIMMYGCLITVLVQATVEAGGPASVYKAAYEGGRMDFFKASLWTSIPSFVMSFLTTSAGLALYAVFKNCDPLSKESGVGLKTPDQIVPYYIVSRLTSYPGLPGLCISGILSASISSLSSAINSLSTVFMEDFIKVYLSQNIISNIKLNLCAKSLVAVHGVAIILRAFLTSIFQSVLQGVVVLDGMILGPTLGLYTLGILTQTANEKGALIGLILGALLSGWIGLGSSFFGTKYDGKPLETTNCESLWWNNTLSDCCNTTAAGNNVSNATETTEYIFPLYRMSYMWTYCIGAACSVIVGYTASVIINFHEKERNVDPELLSPIARYWTKLLPVETDIPLKERVVDS